MAISTLLLLLLLFFASALVKWSELNSDIRKSPLYSTFKKKTLSFIRPHCNDVFNVSHPKGLILITRLRVGFSHLREQKFKHRFLDTLNLFVFVVLISKHWIISFSTAQDLLTKDKTFSLNWKDHPQHF